MATPSRNVNFVNARKNLLESDSDSDAESPKLEFRINQSYANNYDKWRGKEELQKLKDKYGDVDDESDESDSEDEDDDAESVTSQVEKDFFRTLSMLKSKDPKVYDKNENFFNSNSNDDEGNRKPKNQRVRTRVEKPIYIKDYERKAIIENEGWSSDNECASSVSDTHPESPSYAEEQAAAKKRFAVIMESDDGDDGEDLLSVRHKSKAELEKDEEDYRQWLKGTKQEMTDKEMGTDLQYLKEYWNKPDLDEGEAFLKDFLLNKRYVEHTSEELPTYEEIVADEPDLSDDEAAVEEQEQFEHNYNFRFEEPDSEFIKTFPRTTKDSLRRRQEQRGEKRKERKTRKAKEKDKVKEELKQLKVLQKREILEKMDKLKKVIGTEELAVTEKDLNNDFDPTYHDEMMERIFNEDFYDVEEANTKPVFPSDNEDEVNWDNWNVKTKSADKLHEARGTTDDDRREAAVNSSTISDTQRTSWQNDFSQQSKKLDSQKSSRFMEVIKRSKPLFNPETKSFDEYFDEFYKLDFEDVIGDQPCRFKYRDVLPNDFGLSVNDILNAKDKELNAWASVKKTCQYRTQEEERYDLQAFSKKTQNEIKRSKILPSLYQSEETKNPDGPKKRRRRKRKADDLASSLSADGAPFAHSSVKPLKSDYSEETEAKRTESVGKMTELSVSSASQGGVSKNGGRVEDSNFQPKNKRSKRKVKKKTFEQLMTADRLKAYGLNPKKYKNKFKVL